MCGAVLASTHATKISLILNSLSRPLLFSKKKQRVANFGKLKIFVKKKKMIKEFQKHKWYRFIGRTRPSEWNKKGGMDFVLDGQPVKCFGVEGSFLAFLGGNSLSEHLWYWGPGSCWEEINLLKVNLDKILQE